MSFQVFGEKHCPKCKHLCWPENQHHTGYCAFCQKKCDGLVDEAATVTLPPLPATPTEGR